MIHDFLAGNGKVVDGGPEPVLGRAFGPTRGPAMTTEGQPFHDLVSLSLGSVLPSIASDQPNGSHIFPPDAEPSSASSCGGPLGGAG
jgi:hypothetical protein